MSAGSGGPFSLCCCCYQIHLVIAGEWWWCETSVSAGWAFSVLLMQTNPPSPATNRPTGHFVWWSSGVKREQRARAWHGSLRINEQITADHNTISLWPSPHSAATVTLLSSVTRKDRSDGMTLWSLWRSTVCSIQLLADTVYASSFLWSL